MKTITNLLLLLSLMTLKGTAAIIGATDASFDTTASPNDIRVSNTLVSYTNSAGTFSNLSGVTEASVTTGSDYFRAYWAIDTPSTPVDERKLDSTALLGMDIGFGVIDLQTADFQFGGLVGDGIDTNGNDIVLFEIGSLDAGTVIKPLDSDGNEIGDFTLSLGSSTWSSITQVIDFNLITTSGSNGDAYGDAKISAVGFDLSDFSGTTGTLTGMTGIRITSSDSLDLGIAAATIIPEPGTFALLAGILSFSWITIRRR